MNTSRQREPNIAFRSQGLRPVLERRGRPGIVARRDLQRYYELIGEALAETNLTLGEARAIARVSDPLLRSDAPVHHYLTAALAEALGHNNALVAKVRALSPLHIRAIVDALEQRIHLLDGGGVDSDALFTQVGLVR